MFAQGGGRPLWAPVTARGKIGEKSAEIEGNERCAFARRDALARNKGRKKERERDAGRQRENERGKILKFMKGSARRPGTTLFMARAARSMLRGYGAAGSSKTGAHSSIHVAALNEFSSPGPPWKCTATLNRH